jgi:hypothetical protein
VNRSVPESINRWLGAALAILLVSAVWAAFHPALNAEFVQWDDDLNITANPHIRSLNGESLRWMFTDVAYARRYMPLAWLNWAVNFQITGLSSCAFHLGNLLFHTANAFLVWLLIGRLLDLTLGAIRCAVAHRAPGQCGAGRGALGGSPAASRVRGVGVFANLQSGPFVPASELAQLPSGAGRDHGGTLASAVLLAVGGVLCRVAADLPDRHCGRLGPSAAGFFPPQADGPG